MILSIWLLITKILIQASNLIYVEYFILLLLIILAETNRFVKTEHSWKESKRDILSTFCIFHQRCLIRRTAIGSF